MFVSPKPKPVKRNVSVFDILGVIVNVAADAE